MVAAAPVFTVELVDRTYTWPGPPVARTTASPASVKTVLVRKSCSTAPLQTPCESRTAPRYSCHSRVLTAPSCWNRRTCSSKA